MKNPFKDNSLASFLFGIIVGAGACTGFFAVTEPEVPTNPQGQMSGLISVPMAENNTQQQQTGGDGNTQTPPPEEADVNTPSATNDNPEIIHTKWYDGEKYHGLADNPDGDVRVTIAGNKYHRPSCKHIQGHDFIRVTQSDAEQAGLTPCKGCKP